MIKGNSIPVRGVLASILMLVAGAMFFTYHEYSRKPVRIEKATANYVLTSQKLIDEFEYNPEVADKKYVNKIISVSGIIKELSNVGQGGYVSFGSDTTLSSIRCTLDSMVTAKGFAVGSEITLKGVYVGLNNDELLGKDIIMNRCIPISIK